MVVSWGKARQEIILVAAEIKEQISAGIPKSHIYADLKKKGKLTCAKTAFYKYVKIILEEPNAKRPPLNQVPSKLLASNRLSHSVSQKTLPAGPLPDAARNSTAALPQKSDNKVFSIKTTGFEHDPDSSSDGAWAAWNLQGKDHSQTEETEEQES